MKMMLLLVLLFNLVSCQFQTRDTVPGKIPQDSLRISEQAGAETTAGPNQSVQIFPADNSSGSTIGERFLPPGGYVRVPCSPGSFQEYLRNLPLKPAGSKVLLFNGQEKSLQEVAAAVIDRAIGKKDLHQCADAIMRIRAEYFYGNRQYDSIRFHFTSGQLFDYRHFARGYRPVFSGNYFSWEKETSEDYGPERFREYLEILFTYAGTLSLSAELETVTGQLPEAGDVFIQGGSPGHAVLVADMAIHPETGEKLMLLAQSYMPAQEMHLLHNFNEPGISPWYRVIAGTALDTPEWIFPPGSLKRFH